MEILFLVQCKAALKVYISSECLDGLTEVIFAILVNFTNSIINDQTLCKKNDHGVALGQTLLWFYGQFSLKENFSSISKGSNFIG